MPDRFIGDATGVFAQLVEAAAPSTPTSGYVRLYPKTDHKLYYQASTGGEKTVGTMDNPMTTAGALIVGSGTVASLSGAGGSLVAGDILQITAPGSQDATLADVGFTLKVTLT